MSRRRLALLDSNTGYKYFNNNYELR